MAAMSVKFLLTICLTSTFGHMVRNQPDLGNPAPQWQDLDVGNYPQQWQDLDVDNPPRKWQDLVTLVYGKIEGMERLLAKKDERIDQLEFNSASQTNEIMQLKRDMTSLEHALLQKDEVMEKLATRVSDLETFVMFDSTPGEHQSLNIARSHLPKTKNKETQLGLGKPSDSRSGSSVWKMSTSQPSISQTSTYQNGSIVPTYSKQHNENDDDPLLNQDDTTAHTENEEEDLLMAKFSRFQQKRVAPSTPSPRTTVAFHVTISGNKIVAENEVVVYDHDTLDQGDGYNPGVGLYITPESGTYIITWTSICWYHNLFQTVLVVNGVVRGSSWAESKDVNDFHQSTAVVVLTLNQGDHVFIRMGHTYGHGTIVSDSQYGMSTLSGWKLD